MILSDQTGGKRGAFVFLSKCPATIPLNNRLRERSFKLRFRRLHGLLRYLKIVAFLIVTACLSYYAIVQLKHLFFHTSYFEIKKIEVHGLRSLSRESVLKLAGVAPAMNLLRLDLNEIRERLLLHPAIKVAEIELVGLYTLRIKLEERIPLMYIKTENAFLEVAIDGKILSHDSFGEGDLPIVTGLPLSGKIACDSIANNDDFIFAKSWVKTLGPNIIKGLSELNLANPSEPYLFLISGEKVIPKSMEDFRD
ncbi:FtsQ-type POTRA domain-containing protein [bacterium]|nr:FtsQ-type POTRA domain-containing protein [bacterium]